ncbi:HAD family acid phosphatase [Erwinia oleae]|uniref:HAD family acid phosphatase n=1 Tax=Erwinia oleae TaxID=796334 RepID=UPI000A00619A|nr:HAD family acid phosphatase [Erwinia oleae]
MFNTKPKTILTASVLIVLSFSSSAQKSLCDTKQFYTPKDISSVISSKFPEPENVGFDVDDTLLFSTPSFVLGKAIFSINSDAWSHDANFWQQVNNDLLVYSKKKESMQKIINYHLKRDDNIYFITDRPRTNTEGLSSRLANDFNIPFYKRNVVIFKSYIDGVKRNKDYFIKRNNIAIYYGDSDSDIIHDRNTVLKLRVLRSAASQNQSHYHPGVYCEFIITDTDY